MIITSSAYTHVGNVRTNNEDNFYIDGTYKKSTSINILEYNHVKERKHHTYAICDGMGGEKSGEIAALRAVETLLKYDKPNLDNSFDALVQKINMLICNERTQTNQVVGSTISILVIKKSTFSLCNLGDSRIYLFRGGSLTQLSKDHTKLQQLRDAGFAVSGTSFDKMKHILTQHLGIPSDDFVIEPYILKKQALSSGDYFLICSDGLTDMVDDSNILGVFSEFKNSPPNMISSHLISLALQNGGKDNVSVIVIKAI